MGIPFPALPNLLLSASDLVDLSLTRLPHSGYHFTRVDGRLLVLFEQAQITFAWIPIASISP
jgi:hypothetical protein